MSDHSFNLMRQSQLLSKTTKEAPKEETATNARLLEQAGYIQKVLAGVYSFLPLGTRVLAKIENIVREEMNTLATEVLLPALQPKENWEKTGRWSNLDVLFKVKSQHGFEYALGPTHEEVISPAAKSAISSYRDLPQAVYQIQTKFRDETRAKSGLLRGREFRMKDLYSFHASQEDLNTYYDAAIPVYEKIFKRLGLKSIFTEASGGSFAKFSHEFQVEVPAGEDTIYICNKCGLAKNLEVYSGKEEKCSSCASSDWRETKACEVGNIFKLGTKYSEPFELNFVDENNKSQPVIMGCYGLGTTRVMGVIAEIYSDEKGLAWPESIAPFRVHILPLSAKDEKINSEVRKEAHKLYEQLQQAGIEVLLDDREENAGIKFADSDLIGIPHRLIISEKTLVQQSAEWKERSKDEAKMVKLSEVLKLWHS